MNKQTSRFFFLVFSFLVVAISAATSFAFFYEYLSEIIPPVVGGSARRVLAGLIGVVIFDGGALAWLYARLNVADNEEQRTIAFWLSLFDLGASAVASFAQLVLSGGQLVLLSDADKWVISVIALFVSAFAIIANFAAFWLYTQESETAKDARRENIRRDRITKGNEEFARFLDNSIVEKTKEKLHARAAELAEGKAVAIVTDWVNTETGQTAGQVVANPPPLVVANDGKPEQPPVKLVAKKVSLNGLGKENPNR